MAGETSSFFFVTPILREMIPNLTCIFQAGGQEVYILEILKTFALHEITKVVNPFSADLQGNKAKPPKKQWLPKTHVFLRGSLSAITSVFEDEF